MQRSLILGLGVTLLAPVLWIGSHSCDVSDARDSDLLAAPVAASDNGFERVRRAEAALHISANESERPKDFAVTAPSFVYPPGHEVDEQVNGALIGALRLLWLARAEARLLLAVRLGRRSAKGA